MFRSEGASEEWQADTKKRVTETIETFAEDLRIARAQAKTNFDDLESQQVVAQLENQYAWLVGNTIGDIDEAIRASEHSVQIYQGDGGFLDTLGRCYYRKGDLESALKYQRQAVKASPHEMQIQRQLALFELEAAKRSADAPSK